MKTSFIFSVLLIGGVVYSQPKDSLLTNRLRFFSPDSASLYSDAYVKVKSCRLANIRREYAILVLAASKKEFTKILSGDVVRIIDQEWPFEIMRRKAVLPPPKWPENYPPMLNLTGLPDLAEIIFR